MANCTRWRALHPLVSEFRAFPREGRRRHRPRGEDSRGRDAAAVRPVEANELRAFSPGRQIGRLTSATVAGGEAFGAQSKSLTGLGGLAIAPIVIPIYLRSRSRSSRAFPTRSRTSPAARPPRSTHYTRTGFFTSGAVGKNPPEPALPTSLRRRQRRRRAKNADGARRETRQEEPRRSSGRTVPASRGSKTTARDQVQAAGRPDYEVTGLGALRRTLVEAQGLRQPGPDRAASQALLACHLAAAALAKKRLDSGRGSRALGAAVRSRSSPTRARSARRSRGSSRRTRPRPGETRIQRKRPPPEGRAQKAAPEEGRGGRQETPPGVHQGARLGTRRSEDRPQPGEDGAAEAGREPGRAEGDAGAAHNAQTDPRGAGTRSRRTGSRPVGDPAKRIGALTKTRRAAAEARRGPRAQFLSSFADIASKYAPNAFPGRSGGKAETHLYDLVHETRRTNAHLANLVAKTKFPATAFNLESAAASNG